MLIDRLGILRFPLLISGVRGPRGRRGLLQERRRAAGQPPALLRRRAMFDTGDIPISKLLWTSNGGAILMTSGREGSD